VADSCLLFRGLPPADVRVPYGGVGAELSPSGWTDGDGRPGPGPPRRTFLSLMSDSDVAVEKIARLVGHASSKVTETIYRHQLRPVMTTGTETMDARLREVG
jgi:integrase